MIWKSIRLELGQTEDFPRGSPSRVYLLRLPIGDRGEIDRQAFERQPGRATVRRFWPSEPDRTGYAIPAGGGMQIRYDQDQPDAVAGWLDGDAFTLGASMAMIEPDGTRLPLRVAALEEFA